MEVPLEKGYHSITLKDVAFEKKLDITESRYSMEENCTLQPIGKLDGNQYKADVVVHSEIGKAEVSFHVRGEHEDIPLLPFWGLNEEVNGAQASKYTIPFEAREKENYTLYICEKRKQATPSVTLDAATIDRIPQPVLTLSQIFPAGEPKTSTVQVTQPTNTQMILSIPKDTVGILSLKLPYVSQDAWLGNNEFKTVEVEGSKLGVLIDPEKNQEGEHVLNYRIQKYYHFGWVLSIFGFVGSIIILLDSGWRWKQKQK
jgi:hypothetical protein